MALIIIADDDPFVCDVVRCGRALRRFREASSDVENYLRPRIKSAVRPARIG